MKKRTAAWLSVVFLYIGLFVAIPLLAGADAIFVVKLNVVAILLCTGVCFLMLYLLKYTRGEE